MLAYVIQTLAWLAFGLVVGYAVGCSARGLHAIRGVLVHTEHASDDVEQQPVSSSYVPRRLLRFPWLDNHVLGAAIIALAAMTVAVGTISTIRETRIIECQAEYNRAFTVAVAARSELAGDDRDALDALVDRVAVAVAADDAATIRDELTRYSQSRAETRAERAETPLPEPLDPDSCR